MTMKLASMMVVAVMLVGADQLRGRQQSTDRPERHNTRIRLVFPTRADSVKSFRVLSWAAPAGDSYDASGDLIVGATTSQAGDPRLKEVASYVNKHVRPWIGDPLIVSTVNAQNAESKKLTQVQINTLDIGFLNRSDKELISSKMGNKLSAFLTQKKQDGGEVVLEIFIFDNRGLNVAQTDLTADYLQGDEAKYWKSFGVGPDAMVVEKIAPDGGKPHISQASLTIKDPSTGKAIGAMTVGIDYDQLVKANK